MCNYLHPDSKSIKKSGKGWKVFRKDGTAMKLPTSRGRRHYKKEEGSDWVVWDHDNNLSNGFCIFLNKKVAERLIKSWVTGDNSDELDTFVLRKIEYRRGLGKHIENHLSANKEWPIAIVKEFRIVNE